LHRDPAGIGFALSYQQSRTQLDASGKTGELLGMHKGSPHFGEESFVFFRKVVIKPLCHDET
jgi:hypothetical protein